MQEYWKDHFNENVLKFPDSPLKQVEATVYGREVDEVQLNLIVAAIVTNLSLRDSEAVADLCCGNGVITKRIAAICRRVYGVDFSENLISQARILHNSENAEYLVSDVAVLPSAFFKNQTKGYMCYALQHLTTTSFESLLYKVAKDGQWTSFFVSGIPNLERISAFYDTEEKMTFYRQKEAAGEPHLGKWWSYCELESIARNAGMRIDFLEQPATLFTSHYRFDCLFSIGEAL